MHGNKSARERLAAPGYADGGLIGGFRRLIGAAKPETMTEKFARQDAERAARSGKAAPAPAPAPASSTQIGGMDLSVTERRLRQAEQGLKDGGAVRAKLIRGPGTGTSDSIPAKKEAGTVIMPADTTKQMVDVKVSDGESEFPPEVAQAVGTAALLAMRDATHVPTEPGLGFQPEQPQFADGGVIEEEERRRRVSQIPATEGSFPTPDGNRVNSTELGRNVSNALAVVPGGAGAARGVNAAMALRPAAQALAAPSGAALAYGLPVAAGGALMGAANASDPRTALSSAPTPQAPARPAVTAPPPSGAVDIAMPPAPAPNPNNITREGNSYSGGPNITSAGLTINGAPPRTGAISAQNMGAADALAASQDMASTGRVLAQQQAAVPAPVAPRQNAADQLGFYRGIRMTPDLYAQNFGQRALRERLGQEGTAISAAATDSTNRLGINARTAVETNGQAISSQDNLARQRLGFSRLALDADTQDPQTRSRAVLAGAQEAVVNAKTPEERATAQQRLQALSGAAQAPRFTVVPGGQDEMGNRQASSVFNNQTGQFVQQPAAPTAPPAGAVAMLRTDPKLAAQFDAKYGPGASARILATR